jgi:hypothetical protein
MVWYLCSCSGLPALLLHVYVMWTGAGAGHCVEVDHLVFERGTDNRSRVACHSVLTPGMSCSSHNPPCLSAKWSAAAPWALPHDLHEVSCPWPACSGKTFKTGWGEGNRGLKAHVEGCHVNYTHPETPALKTDGVWKCPSCNFSGCRDRHALHRHISRNHFVPAS